MGRKKNTYEILASRTEYVVGCATVWCCSIMCHSNLTCCFREFINEIRNFMRPAVPFLLQSAVSMGSYTAGLALSQGVGAALRISCASPAIGSLGGMVGVGVASVAAGQASEACFQAYAARPKKLDGYFMIFEQVVTSFDKNRALMDVILGVTAFKIVGGSFRTIMPSDLNKVGAIAKESIPAAGMQYATDEKRRELIRMFRRDGCHHCGSRKGMVIGDHMPPNKHVIQRTEAMLTQIVDRMYRNSGFRRTMQTLGIRPLSDVRQRYFPQCVSCSQKQSSAVRNNKSRRVFHSVLHGGGKGTGWHYIGVWIGASHGLID